MALVFETKLVFGYPAEGISLHHLPMLLLTNRTPNKWQDLLWFLGLLAPRNFPENKNTTLEGILEQIRSHQWC